MEEEVEFICDIKPVIIGNRKLCPLCWGEHGIIMLLKQGQYLCPHHTLEWKEAKADKRIKLIAKKKKGGKPRKWNNWQKRILDVTHDEQYQHLVEIAFKSSIDAIRVLKEAMIKYKDDRAEIFHSYNLKKDREKLGLHKKDENGNLIVHPENDLLIKSLIKGYGWTMAEKIVEINDIKSIAHNNVLEMAITVEVQSLLKEQEGLRDEGKELEAVDKEELDRLIKIQREVEQVKQDKRHLFEEDRNTKTLQEEKGDNDESNIDSENLMDFDLTESQGKVGIDANYEKDEYIASEVDINPKKDKYWRGDDIFNHVDDITRFVSTMEELNRDYGATGKDNEIMRKDKRKETYLNWLYIPRKKKK